MTTEPAADFGLCIEGKQHGPRHPPGRARQLHDLQALLRLTRRRWYLFAPVFAVWALAYARLFVDPAPRVPVLFNWTPSLPYHVALLQPGSAPLQRGDLVVYRFAGEGLPRHGGLRGQPFFKSVGGLPGDTVTVEGRSVFVNGAFAGWAKPYTHDRLPLSPIAPVVIPAGHYYMLGTGADSFDSRYRESGLVRADQMLGVVQPLF